jgi:dihydroflavonol-4-reductase
MFLVTGAAGFLGSEIVRQLLLAGERVRALILPGDPLGRLLPAQAEQVSGDLLNAGDMERFFDLAPGTQARVIHCASMITMSMKPQEMVYRVNVRGTQELAARCMARGVPLVYVGSVHAIPELPHGRVMSEPEAVDPNLVVGYYAKTKAMAARGVMQARQAQGLRASVVYPAGLSGPGDEGRGNLTQLFLDYLDGSIPFGVKGGYNFADVRDVAAAIVTLARGDNLGRDYVLSGEYISIMDILSVFHQVSGGRRIIARVPLWLARAALPLMSLAYKIRGVKPVFSAYSLYTINANSHFDASRARQELGYAPRPIRETLADTARWLMARREQGMKEL